MKTTAQELQSLVGECDIREWESLPTLFQERIAKANSADNFPRTVVYPSTVEDLARVMNCAHRQGWSVLACGSGSKLGWGGVGKAVDLVISTERLNHLIEHAVADLSVTVEAGVKFADLQEILLKKGQFLPLEPAYHQDATLGGIIATADSGSWRQRYGGVRDMLLGISFVRSDGQIAKAGGRVVKNVAGYDLMKLFTGSYGTLGIITQVTLRVYPVPETAGTVILTGQAEAIASVTKTLLSSTLTPTAVDLLSTGLVNQLAVGQEGLLGLMVRFQTVQDAVQKQSSHLLEVGRQLGLTGSLYTDSEDAHLWQSLPKQIWTTNHEQQITCKIGVLPNAAVTILTQLDNLTSSSGLALIHAASGLGKLRLDAARVKSQTVAELRNHCQSNSGFLTVLEAPLSWKQELDIWGYSGNSLPIMHRLKQQFDPKNLLSPGRFVGGI